MKPTPDINQAFYDELGSTWNEGSDHPIALLRAEAAFRWPWILEKIEAHAQGRVCRVLDIGCGGGLLSNRLAKTRHEIFGVDISAPSLKVAAESDTTGRVSYVEMSADQLDFQDASVDVACILDVLEHVENPGKCIEEIARVLKPGGLVLLYTFNRTWQSWLFAVKVLDWFFRQGPKHVHVYRWFIKPEELSEHLEAHGLTPREWIGSKPKLGPRVLYDIVVRGRVPEGLTFRFCKSLAVGYYGVAYKK